MKRTPFNFIVGALFCSLAAYLTSAAFGQDGDLSKESLKPIELVSPPPARYLDPNNIHYQTAPSVAISRGGRLWVAIMTGGKTEDNDNYIDVITSGDGGKTWSEPKFALDIPGPVRAFDSGIWTDPDGRVWVFWCQVYDFWDGRGGLWATVCDNPDDENAQWSQPRRICDGDMKNKPLVLKNGEIWLMVEQWQDDTNGYWSRLASLPELPKWYVRAEHLGCNVYRSTDSGKTFEYYSTVPIDPKVRTCDEAMTIEREDGTYRMLIRLKTGMGESISTDGGKTWTQAVDSPIKNPAARFHWVKLKSGNVLLIKNGPIDVQTDRRDITAYLSEDDGETFPYSLPLDMRRGPSYPDACQAEDGTIYSVHDFDREGLGEMILDVFTEEDIKAGKLVSPQSKLHTIMRKNAPK